MPRNTPCEGSARSAGTRGHAWPSRRVWLPPAVAWASMESPRRVTGLAPGYNSAAFACVVQTMAFTGTAAVAPAASWANCAFGGRRRPVRLLWLPAAPPAPEAAGPSLLAAWTGRTPACALDVSMGVPDEGPVGVNRPNQRLSLSVSPARSTRRRRPRRLRRKPPPSGAPRRLQPRRRK